MHLAHLGIGALICRDGSYDPTIRSSFPVRTPLRYQHVEWPVMCCGVENCVTVEVQAVLAQIGNARSSS